MGEQRNLTEENVEELKAKLEQMQVNNPELEYRFFNQNSPAEKFNDKILKEVLEKMESLERKIDLIFDGHVLMDGEFKKINLTKTEGE